MNLTAEIIRLLYEDEPVIEEDNRSSAAEYLQYLKNKGLD